MASSVRSLASRRSILCLGLLRPFFLFVVGEKRLAKTPQMTARRRTAHGQLLWVVSGPLSRTVAVVFGQVHYFSLSVALSLTPFFTTLSFFPSLSKVLVGRPSMKLLRRTSVSTFQRNGGRVLRRRSIAIHLPGLLGRSECRLGSGSFFVALVMNIQGLFD